MLFHTKLQSQGCPASHFPRAGTRVLSEARGVQGAPDLTGPLWSRLRQGQRVEGTQAPRPRSSEHQTACYKIPETPPRAEAPRAGAARTAWLCPPRYWGPRSPHPQGAGAFLPPVRGCTHLLESESPPRVRHVHRGLAWGPVWRCQS